MAYTRPDKIKATAHIETIVHKADLKNGFSINPSTRALINFETKLIVFGEV